MRLLHSGDEEVEIPYSHTQFGVVLMVDVAGECCKVATSGFMEDLTRLCNVARFQHGKSDRAYRHDQPRN